MGEIRVIFAVLLAWSSGKTAFLLDSDTLMKRLKSIPADIFTDLPPQGTVLVQRHSHIRVSEGDAENDRQVVSDSQFSADRIGIARGHGLGAGAQTFCVSC